jgi:hypothetical protein
MGQAPDRSYEPSAAHPFGSPHPDYADQLTDFAPMIGECSCKSVNRQPDGTWIDTISMTWRFKYTLNGTAIMDESWKADGVQSGSMRQYIADSSAWAVTYFSSKNPAATPGVWMGGKDGENVVLYMDQKAPNGMEGVSRLTFYNIDDNGYDWIGEWVSSDGQFVYPFWKIFCSRNL